MSEKYDEKGQRVKRKCNYCSCHFFGTTWDCEDCDCWMDMGDPVPIENLPSVLIIIPARSRADVDDETLDLINEAFEEYCTETGDWWNWKTEIATAKGYGNAIKSVMMANPGFKVYVTCADDLATPALFLPPLARKVLDGYDLVVGSRRMPNALTLRAPKTMIRGVASNLFNILFSKMFATGLYEHYGDTRAFSAKFVEKVLPETQEKHFFWIPECIVATQRLGYKVAEIPIIWDKRFTPSPMKPRRLAEDAKEIVRGFLKLRRRWI